MNEGKKKQTLTPVSVRLTPELKEQLERQARLENRSLSNMICCCIAYYVDKHSNVVDNNQDIM